MQEYSVSPSTPLPVPENIWVAGKFSWCCKDSGAAAPQLHLLKHSTDGMTVPAEPRSYILIIYDQARRPVKVGW